MCIFAYQFCLKYLNPFTNKFDFFFETTICFGFPGLMSSSKIQLADWRAALSREHPSTFWRVIAIFYKSASLKCSAQGSLQKNKREIVWFFTPTPKVWSNFPFFPWKNGKSFRGQVFTARGVPPPMFCFFKASLSHSLTHLVRHV